MDPRLIEAIECLAQPNWTGVVTAVAAVASAFLTAVLAIGILIANRQVNESRKTLKAQVLLKLFDEWRSPGIYESMRFVNSLRQEWKKQANADKWHELAVEWVKKHAGKNANSENDAERELGKAWAMRRTASQFLAKMGALIQGGYLTADEFFRVNPEVNRQLIVLIPIEYAIQDYWSEYEGEPIRPWDKPFPKWEFTQLWKDYEAWFHRNGSAIRTRMRLTSAPTGPRRAKVEDVAVL